MKNNNGQYFLFEKTNQKVLAKEERLKGNRDKTNKIIQTKQDIPKLRKKILSASRRRMGENISATGCDEGRKKML